MATDAPGTAPGAGGGAPAPVRVGLVGLGMVVERYHAPALAELARGGAVRVTSVLDPDPVRMERIGAAFADAARADTVEALAESVDLAIVASPARLHAEQASALLERGVHVLCEKPLARSAAEAEPMLRAAEGSGASLAVGLNRRFYPAVEWIAELVRGGQLGRVTRFHFDEGGRFGWPAVTASVFDREQSGGGVTMDIGAHMFDIAMHWFGAVESFEYADDAYGGVEVNARGRLRFAGGIEGTFHLSWDLPLSGVYAVEFERGWARWATRDANGVTLSLDGTTLVCDARLALRRPRHARGAGPHAPAQLAAYTAQLADMVAAVREGRAPRVEARAGIEGLRLVERLYAGREVLVPPHFTQAERSAALTLARGTPA